MLEDRAGGDIATMAHAADVLTAAARRRPELAYGDQHLPSVGARLLHRHGHGQAADHGDLADRRLQHAADFSRRPVRERLQSVRPYLAGAAAGGAGVSRSAFVDIGRFYVRNSSGNMVPLSTLATAQAFRRSRRGLPLQPLPRDPNSGRSGAGLLQRAGEHRDGRGGGRVPARRASATNGPAPRTRRSRRRATRRPSSASPRCWCFCFWPRSTKAGRFRSPCCSRSRWASSARWPGFTCAPTRTTSTRRSASSP